MKFGFVVVLILSTALVALGQPELSAALKGHVVKGFTLQKSTATSEVWVNPAGARLTLELTRKQSLASVEAKLKATNPGVSGDQLLFRCESSSSSSAWTNYRSDHASTFKVYRYWRLERDILLVQTLTYPQNPKTMVEAQQGFVTMRKVSMDLFKRLAGK